VPPLPFCQRRCFAFRNDVVLRVPFAPRNMPLWTQYDRMLIPHHRKMSRALCGSTCAGALI